MCPPVLVQFLFFPVSNFSASTFNLNFLYNIYFYFSLILISRNVFNSFIKMIKLPVILILQKQSIMLLDDANCISYNII